MSTSDELKAGYLDTLVPRTPVKLMEIALSGLEDSIVTSVDGLASLYAQPVERVAKKELDYVNAAGRAFIAASPFLVLATGGPQGLDCSPKGDQPGFVPRRSGMSSVLPSSSTSSERNAGCDCRRCRRRLGGAGRLQLGGASAPGRSAQPASRPRRLVHVAAMSRRVATGTPSSLFGRHLPDESGQSSIDPRPNGARWALRAGAGTMVSGFPRRTLELPRRKARSNAPCFHSSWLRARPRSMLPRHAQGNTGRVLEMLSVPGLPWSNRF
jgi:hypothetical protein